jgi:hypothetical protein
LLFLDLLALPGGSAAITLLILFEPFASDRYFRLVLSLFWMFSGVMAMPYYAPVAFVCIMIAVGCLGSWVRHNQLEWRSKHEVK